MFNGGDPFRMRLDKHREVHRNGKTGNTKLSEYFGGAPKDKLHAATLNSLQERGWKIISAGNPISASYVKGYQRAFLKIEVSDNKLLIDTKGSLWKNEPYVPLNYIKYLEKALQEISNRARCRAQIQIKWN